MGTFTDTIAIVIKADGAKAASEFKKVGDSAQRELDKASKSSRDWGASLTRAGVGLTTFAGVAGAGLLAAALAADDAAQANLRLENSIKNSPRLAGDAKKAFTDLATALSKKTAADDDSIISGQAVLAQFKLTKDQITQLTPLVVDLSRKLGVDMDTAAKAAAKAVNGSGVALTRMGVQIKAGADGVVGFTDVMSGLKSSVGGFAEAEGKTFSGQLAIMKNQLGEVAEGIGGGVLPMFQSMLGPVRSLADAFGSLSPATQSTIGSLSGFAVAGAGTVGALALIAGQVIKARDAFSTLAEDGSRSLNGLGRAARAVGIAFAGIAIYDVIQSQIGEAAPDVDRLTTSLTHLADTGSIVGLLGDEYGRTFDEIGTTLRRHLAFVKEYQNSGALANLGNTLIDPFTEGATELDRARKQFESLDKAISGLVASGQGNKAADLFKGIRDTIPANELEAFDAIMRESVGSISDYASTSGDASKATKSFGTELRNTTNPFGALMRSLIGMGGAQKEAATGADRHRRSLSDLIGQMDNYNDRVFGAKDSTRDFASAQLDVADAIQGQKDALARLNELEKSGTASTDEIAAAQRDFMRATIDVSQSQDDAARAAIDHAKALSGYDEAGKNSRATNEKFRDSLLAIAQSLSPGDPLRTQLEGYLQHLGKVPPEKKTDVSTPGADESRGKVQGLKSDLDALHDKQVTITVNRVANFLGGALDGFARGGKPKRGEPVIVGERGPEIAVFDGRTTIIPNEQLASLKWGGRSTAVTASGGGGGGDTFVFNFHGPVASQRQAEDWVLSAIASARRSGKRVAA